MQYKSFQYFFIFFFIIFVASCSNEKEQLKDEINRLKKEAGLRQKDNRQLDSLILMVNIAIDSVNAHQNLLNDEVSSGEFDKKDVLRKIEKLDKYVMQTQRNIVQMEKQLLSERNKNGTQVTGLMLLISKLKKDLQNKEEKIAFLENRVKGLEGNVASLETELTEKKETIRKQSDMIETNNKQIKNIEADKEQIQKQAEIDKINLEIKRFITQAESEEKLGDKYSKITNASKKWEQYGISYNNYKSALDMYISNPQSSSFLNYSKSEIENKMRTVKDKIPERIQKKMNF